MSSTTILFDIVFPAELQKIGPNGTASTDKEEEYVVDSLHIRMTNENGEAYEISLWSETDIFFHLVSKLDRSAFDQLRREQRLVVGFEDFPGSFKKLLQGCSAAERAKQAAVLLLDQVDAELHIVCKMEHKIVELLSCPFARLSDDQIKSTVQKRFQEMKLRAEAAEAKLSEYHGQNARSGKVPSLLQKGNAHNPGKAW